MFLDDHTTKKKKEFRNQISNKPSRNRNQREKRISLSFFVLQKHRKSHASSSRFYGDPAKV